MLEPLPEPRSPEPPPSDESLLELCLPERLPESLEPLSEPPELRADRLLDLALDTPEPLSETLLSLAPEFSLAFLPAFVLACLPELPPPSREPTAPVVERTASLAASECVIELVSPLSADPAELTASPGLDWVPVGAEARGAGVLNCGLSGAAGPDWVPVDVCA